MDDLKRMLVCEKLRKYISKQNLYIFSESLRDVPENSLDYLMILPLKNPMTTLLLSIFLGGWGADRLYLGDAFGYLKMVLGLLRLIMGFVCGIALEVGNLGLYIVSFVVVIFLELTGMIWWIIDICILSNRTKEENALELVEKIEVLKKGEKVKIKVEEI